MSQNQAASKEYRTHCLKRVAELNQIAKQAKEHVKKLDKSPNKDAFQDQLLSLTEISDAATTISELLGMMPSPTPDPEVFLATLDKCRAFSARFGLGLGPGFAMKCLLAKVNEACLHCNYERLCEILCQDGKDAQDIVSSSVTMDHLRKANEACKSFVEDN